ncbi:acylphosphatase [Thiolapillus brandeum]|uniref:acylphosphatase n=1 Tax=Thiolapillus brandeum TaxID=1076588 RepID=A0A7U6JJ10_9GAMM|nr:acylphosphatase [Thiolapillus brandeum]BAO45293.1 acylphosphatase [Thiolapillus brandeum]
MKCIRCQISGRVQGVWFRETTRRKALELGLQGQAMNMPDGTVQVTACGDQDALEALQRWLWKGSPLSRVDNVYCEALTEPESYRGFDTR